MKHIIPLLVLVAACDGGRSTPTDGSTTDGSTSPSCQLLRDPGQLDLDLTNRTAETFLQIFESTNHAVRLYTACVDLDQRCRSFEVEIPLAELTGSLLTYPRFTFNWSSGQADQPFIAVTLTDPNGHAIDSSSTDWQIMDDKGHRIYHHPNQPLVFGSWTARLVDQRTGTGPVQVMIAVNAVCSGSCPGQ